MNLFESMAASYCEDSVLRSCVWKSMQKENGDTEIAFLAAVFFWLATFGTGWLSKSIFESWQSGTAFELVGRKARILNLFPTWFIFILSVVAVAFEIVRSSV